MIISCITFNSFFIFTLHFNFCPCCPLYPLKFFGEMPLPPDTNLKCILSYFSPCSCNHVHIHIYMHIYIHNHMQALATYYKNGIIYIIFLCAISQKSFKVPSIAFTHCFQWFRSTTIYLSILVLMVFFPILYNVYVNNLVDNPYRFEGFFI